MGNFKKSEVVEVAAKTHLLKLYPVEMFYMSSLNVSVLISISISLRDLDIGFNLSLLVGKHTAFRT